MARFVISDDLFFFRRNDLVLFFQSADHPVHGILEIFHVHRFFPFSGSYQCRFITYIGDIGAGKPGSLFGQFMNIQCLRNFYRNQVNFKNRFPAHQIGLINRNLAVETTGS